MKNAIGNEVTKGLLERDAKVVTIRPPSEALDIDTLISELSDVPKLDSIYICDISNVLKVYRAFVGFFSSRESMALYVVGTRINRNAKSPEQIHLLEQISKANIFWLPVAHRFCCSSQEARV